MECEVTIDWVIYKYIHHIYTILILFTKYVMLILSHNNSLASDLGNVFILHPFVKALIEEAKWLSTDATKLLQIANLV